MGFSTRQVEQSRPSDLAFHFVRVLSDLLFDLIRQLIQLTLSELQQLSLLTEFLLAEFPAVIRHSTHH